MKDEFLRGKTGKKQRKHSKLKDISEVTGGKENTPHRKLLEFPQKETQEEWIDLMGIPKK